MWKKARKGESFRENKESPQIELRYVSVLKLHNYAILLVAVVVLLFYVHGKQLRSCRDGQLT